MRKKKVLRTANLFDAVMMKLNFKEELSEEELKKKVEKVFGTPEWKAKKEESDRQIRKILDEIF